jgi:hypothetical protein
MIYNQKYSTFFSKNQNNLWPHRPTHFLPLLAKARDAYGKKDQNFFSNQPFIHNRLKLFINSKLLFFRANLFLCGAGLNILFISCLFFFKFYSCLKGDLLGLFVFIFSTILTSFMINKGMFSNNFIIRIIQLIIFYTILLTISTFFLFTAILGYEFILGDAIQCASNDDDKFYKVPKELVNKALDVSTEIVKETAVKVIPNLGAGAAAGSAASTVLKMSATLPPAQRLVLAGSAAFVVGRTTQLGLSTGTSIAKNIDLNDMIKDSPHANTKLDRAPSPDPNFTINSPLEYGDIETSPLHTILVNVLSINTNILLLILILSYVLISRYFLSSNKNFIWKFLEFLFIKINLKRETIE